MDKATLERIFEPFFTTKKREGTGLGLAIVHGIVKGMNGWINVYSEPGQGTTFKIHLPRVDRDADEEVVHVDTMLGGTETILYVDDEVFITEMAREMLEAFGYRVEPRTSSIEALKAFRAKPDRFDLIITDQTMPNMTGLDLIREVHSIRGDIPVILCTGFSESVTNERAKGTGISEIIYKPFIKKDFLKAVRRVIDKPRAGGEGRDTASRQ
jgi:CheY-like chemotaxis protein